MKFSSVAELFKQVIPAQDQAQLVVYHRGEKVIDETSGIEPDKLIGIYSVSKALIALTVAKLVETGRLDLSKKVVDYWPEFGFHGKDLLTVRQLLSHQAGLPETKVGLTANQIHTDHAAAALLAAEQPFWAPGSAFGYHAVTIGILVSELVFRITGKTLQEVFESEIRSVSGSDVYLGLPIELHGRFAPPLPPIEDSEPAPEGSLRSHVFKLFAESNMIENGIADLFFTKERLFFGTPAAGGVASARGLAHLFNWAVNQNGISTTVLNDFSKVQVCGRDQVLDQDDRAFGTLFMKPTSVCPFGSESAYGHDGAAGAIVFVDPAKEIILAYTVRRMTNPGGMDPRLITVIDKLNSVI